MLLKCNDFQIIMCGGTSMILSSLHALKTLDYSSNLTFIYGPFGTELIKQVYGRNAKLSDHVV